MARRRLFLLALLLITFLAYKPVWHGGMLWDDDGHLTSGALQSADGLRRIWFDVGATQQYYPVVHTAFWIMNALWGSNMLGYHLVTIALHALVAWLLFVVLKRLEIPGARIAALIFALHPVHVESVAWVTELKNTFSGVFYLLAALAYLRFDRDRRSQTYAVAISLFVLALLSKSVTATLPVGLLIIFWWQRGRIDWRTDLRPLVPFVVLGLGAGLMTAWVERTFIGAVGSDFQLSLIERCLLAGRAIWFYLAKLVWPVDLTFIYPRWTISQAVLWQYLFPLTAIVMTLVLWRWRARSRAPLAAWLFFVATLGPALGFVDVYPFRYSFVADHFQYLASIGVIALFAATVAVGLTRLGGWTLRRELAAGAILAAPLAVLTWQQSHEYVDAATLYQATLDRNPGCWMAHNNLAAMALVQSPPDLDVASSHVQAALQLNPRNDVAHNNLGLIHQKRGNFPLAASEHEEAIRLNPKYADAHTNLGVDLTALGRTDEAIARHREAIRLAPGSAGPHYNLGSLLLNARRTDEAIAELQEAVRLNPNYADAHNNLGELREAQRLMPDASMTHENLGRVLVRLGRLDEAIKEYEQLLKYTPQSAEAHNDLGVVLAMSGRVSEAVPHFAEAVRLRPDYAEARANLARATGKN
jgi:tetratricopeptide (TPR) repeat protein